MSETRSWLRSPNARGQSGALIGGLQVFAIALAAGAATIIACLVASRSGPVVAGSS